jgi:hypothetical protein
MDETNEEQTRRSIPSETIPVDPLVVEICLPRTEYALGNHAAMPSPVSISLLNRSVKSGNGGRYSLVVEK